MSNAAESPFQTLHEFVKEAKGRLSPGNWDYLVGATETETTMLRNRAAIDAWAFRPRVLRDVSSIDCSGRFLGERISLPVMLAPVGGLENFDPEGGAPAGRAAGAFGCPIMVSSVSMPGLEPMAKAGEGRKVFQLYVRGDWEWIEEVSQRAIDNGYDAFCMTVDTAIYSRRERDIAKRFVKPWRTRATGQHFQAALNWADVKRWKARFPNAPLALKGIATAEDALIAVEHGVEVVYVSNHGGRQLDHGRGSLDVLPEVVKAVNGRAKVWVDGGFVRGTDIVKAIILGAELVGMGRMYCYALAAAGEAGVARMFELLATEVHEVLGLLGVTSFGQLDASYLHAVAPIVPPHVHSAFPLTNLSDPGYR